MIDAVRNAAEEFLSWVAQLKLYWQFPIVVGIAVTATSLLLAIYGIMSAGEVSAIFIDDASIVCLVLVAMAFFAGVMCGDD